MTTPMIGNEASAPVQPWEVDFPDAATEADIAGCFRLLLGRRPHQEEWTGHLSRVGEPLDLVVGSYVNALEFARRGLLEPAPLGEISLVTVQGFAIYAEADDAAVGYHVRGGAYEPDVTAVFHRLVRPGGHVLDLGANIGYFTMLAARLVGPAGSVIAVEPNPRNARMVEASRRANGFDHVTVVQVAAGNAPGLLVLNRAHSNGTTSALPDAQAGAILAAETVGCVRAETLVPPGRRIDVIKADVEGAEYLALRGCTGLIRRDRPLIVSEFAPSMMQGISGIDGPAYLRWLIGLGYGLSIVQPDGTLTPAAPDAIMAEYRRRGVDHLDLVAAPRPATPLARLRRAAGRVLARPG